VYAQSFLSAGDRHRDSTGDDKTGQRRAIPPAGVNPPAQLKEDLLRTAWLSGLTDELDKYKVEFGRIDYQYVRPPGGELVFIWHNGLSPVKAEWGVSATNRRVRVYQLTNAGRKHLQREVSSFERMLKGITHVLAPVKP